MRLKKRVYILIIVISLSFILLEVAIIAQQYTTTRSNFGTLAPPTRAYICGKFNSSHYYVQNNVTDNYELISEDLRVTVSYAVCKLTSGRTWQESVILKGNLVIATTIVLNQSNVLLDCRQSTLTSTASTTAIDIQSANITILGGHWIGQTDGTSITAIRLFGSNAKNCIIDGVNVENFGSISQGGAGAIYFAFGSSNNTIQNSLLHDNGQNYGLDLQGVGYNNVVNCSIYNSRSGMFVSNSCVYNQIIDCEFYGNGNPSIYLDGGSSEIGNNIIKGCYFYNPESGASIIIKSQNNIINGNTFVYFPNQDSVGLSIYSQYNPCYANQNDIFDNTFTNMYYAIWFGNGACLSNTLQNKIHNNTFTNVTNCITLNHDPSTQNIDDTKIYYNTFRSCSNIFPLSSSSPTQIHNTIVAYNDFGGHVDDLSIESYVNTMVFGNIGLDDFNVPSPLPVL